MESENEKMAEETIEKEINLSPVEETNQNDSENNSLKENPKFVQKKNVADLTDEEKAIIFSNFKNGIEQPFYDVKQFKNGRFRVLKRKETKPSVAQKVVREAPPPPKASKIYYSDNQLLFEHIIELNSKVDKLMNKQKKLKKRYQTLQSEIYVDEDSENEEPKIEPEENPPKIESNKQKRGWRSQITFL